MNREHSKLVTIQVSFLLRRLRRRGEGEGRGHPAPRQGARAPCTLNLLKGKGCFGDIPNSGRGLARPVPLLNSYTYDFSDAATYIPVMACKWVICHIHFCSAWGRLVQERRIRFSTFKSFKKLVEKLKRKIDLKYAE